MSADWREVKMPCLEVYLYIKLSSHAIHSCIKLPAHAFFV